MAILRTVMLSIFGGLCFVGLILSIRALWGYGKFLEAHRLDPKYFSADFIAKEKERDQRKVNQRNG